MLDNDLGQFPIFSNMRTLWLRGCVFGNRDGKCSTLDIFLQKTPNLKKLTLEHQRVVYLLMLLSTYYPGDSFVVHLLLILPEFLYTAMLLQKYISRGGAQEEKGQDK
jgi:hypothetical protein